MLEVRRLVSLAATESIGAELGVNATGGAYPRGARSGIVSLDRRVSGCELWVNCGPEWDDVVFRLLGKIGEAWVELDHRTLADAANAERTSLGTTGVLFRYAGELYDEIAVEAYFTGIDHPSAAFILRGWLADGPGSRAARDAIHLFAWPHQEWKITGAIPGNGNAVLKAAPLRRTRNYLTRLVLTRSDPALAVVTLESFVGADPPVTEDQWLMRGDPIVEHFTYPERFPLDAGLRLVVVAAAGTTAFNAIGYEE